MSIVESGIRGSGIYRFRWFIGILLAICFSGSPGYCSETRHLGGPYSQQEELIIEKVRAYRTVSGKSIGQIIDESETKEPIAMERGNVSIGEPYWDIRRDLQNKFGYIISCFQGVVSYNDNAGGHGDGARRLEWYYDGKTVFAISPNDLDETMPAWNSGEVN